MSLQEISEWKFAHSWPTPDHRGVNSDPNPVGTS